MKNDPIVEAGPNITLLKWIVGILGFLIILFIGIIAVTLYNRMTAPKSDNTSAPASVPQPAPAPAAAVVGGAGTPLPAQNFGDVKVAIPDGLELLSLTSDGARMFLTLGAEGKARRIIVLSLADGRELGSFTLEAAAGR